MGDRRLSSPELYQSSISTELARTIQKEREGFGVLIAASPLRPSQIKLGWGRKKKEKKKGCVTNAAQGKVIQWLDFRGQHNRALDDYDEKESG